MKLMVLDGNSIVNRAYYGIRPLTTRQGLYTNAIYGFITTLQRLLDEEKPEALCVTFDRREPTFRHEADAAYKAQRKGMPEELAMQMLPLKQVLTAMSIPQYELTGYEADDLIGTISRKCEAAGWDCVIVTGDKDSLQLITDHTKVKLVSTRMGQTTTKDMTPETFQETYGFAPIHMIDLKALMGDSSAMVLFSTSAAFCLLASMPMYTLSTPKHLASRVAPLMTCSGRSRQVRWSPVMYGSHSAALMIT